MARVNNQWTFNCNYCFSHQSDSVDHIFYNNELRFSHSLCLCLRTSQYNSDLLSSDVKKTNHTPVGGLRACLGCTSVSSNVLICFDHRDFGTRWRCRIHWQVQRWPETSSPTCTCIIGPHLSLWPPTTKTAAQMFGLNLEMILKSLMIEVFQRAFFMGHSGLF